MCSNFCSQPPVQTTFPNLKYVNLRLLHKILILIVTLTLVNSASASLSSLMTPVSALFTATAKPSSSAQRPVLGTVAPSGYFVESRAATRGNFLE